MSTPAQNHGMHSFIASLREVVLLHFLGISDSAFALL